MVKLHNSKSPDLYRDFLKQMKSFRKNGVTVTLEGEILPLKEIADACLVRERGLYMGDFVWDDNGKLKEIRFDRLPEILE